MRRTRRGRGWVRLMAGLGALAALLAGCALGAPTGKPGPNFAKSQVLRLDLATDGADDVATLDPDIVTDINSQMVIDLLYDPLVTLDPQMRVEDWGADRVDVSADGLTYTFHIRAGQGFADGTPVTAADYAYSMNRALDPCLASPVSYYLFQIKDAMPFNSEFCKNGVYSQAPYPLPSGPVIKTLIGDSITALDPATLVVHLTQPGVYFLSALTYPVDAALDPAVVNANPWGEGWLGALTQGRGTSGMFMLHVWDHAGGKLLLTPNPYWWGLAAGKKPYLTEIDITANRDAPGVLSDYQAGKTDVALPDTTDLPAAQTMRGFHRVPTFTTYALTMDWTKAPYNNLDARLALCLAVDRDALNQQLYGGERLPTWHIVPQGMPGYTPWLTGPDGVSSTQGDPTAARAHWQAYLQSLHGAKPPAIAFYYPDYSTNEEKLAQALAQQWQATLGIVAQPRAYATGFLMDSNTHFPLSRFAWQADYPDPQDFLSLLLTASSQYNPGGVSVPEADKLAGQADVTSDPALRNALYHDAEQIYVNTVAWCPLFQGTNTYVARSQVHGWQMDGRGLTPNDTWLATYITRT